jgi:hypothetical protein
MAKKKNVALTVDLIGRICLVRRREQTWAVFLKANQDKNFNTRRSHMPALNLPLERVRSQNVADQSKMTVGAIRKRRGKELADSLGVWSLAGYDMQLKGVKGSGAGTHRVGGLANLNAIVDSVRPGSQFKLGILARDPRPFGIVARLKIPEGATVQGIVEDKTVRTFVPGGHQQVLADFIRVRIPFETPSKGPTLRLKRFGATKGTSYRFRARGGNLTLTMSNLCKCVEQNAPESASGMVSEDREFVVYYKLLAASLPANGRPVPQVPGGIGTTEGVDIPECYRPSRASL